MKLSRLFLTTSLTALAASAAFADLTADQIVDDQVNMMNYYGLEATMEERTRNGNTLTAGPLVATGEMEEGTFTVKLPAIDYIERDDGSVEIAYPSEFPIEISGTGEEGEFTATMVVGYSGSSVIVSGDPDNIRYDYDVERATLSDFTFSAPDMPEDLEFEMTMSADNITGYSAFTGGDVRDYNADISIGSVDMSMNASSESAEDPGKFAFSLSLADLATKYQGAIAEQTLEATLAETVQAGNTTEGSITHGPINYAFMIQSPDGNADVKYSADSAVYDFSLTEAGLNYGGSSSAIALEGLFSQLPIPFSMTAEETSGRFMIPIVPSEEPQTFGISTALRGVAINDALWGMFDPAGQLPRDPASLIVDIEGSGTLQADVFDPEFAEMGGEAPGTLDSITINAVNLAILGAAVDGDGAFEFDNSGAVPQPTGQMNVTLTGVNSLIDTLVNMGLVPQEQAMGARMMMGLFARPGDGPDTLVSTIEVREGGSVFANGQQIR